MKSMRSTIEWVVHAMKSTHNGRMLQPVGVGFAHGDGLGVSLKFDMYPPDTEQDIELVMRRTGAHDGWSVILVSPDTSYDLCLVKDNGGYNKWTQIGKADPHNDHNGYSLRFNMFRPSRHQIESGCNLAIRRARPPVCTKCGK